MKRKTKRFIRNGLLTLSVAVAMVIFVFSSMQFVVTNPWGTLALVLSGGYILAFWWANEE